MKKLLPVFEASNQKTAFIGNSSSLPDDAPKKPLDKKVQEIMKRCSSSSVLTSHNARFSPFRMRPYVETKTYDRSILNSWYRYYYEHDPYVGSAIDLHSEFPLSSFEIDHDDKDLRNEFNDIKEDLNLETLILKMAKEYFVVGEAFVFGYFDDPADPSCWESFILLDPDNITLKAHPFVKGGEWYSILMNADADMKKIVEQGPNDSNTGELYHKLPSDIIDSVRRDEPIKLNSVQASHFKRETNAFQLRGSSMVQRVLPILMYRDKLRDAQFAIAERHLTPKEFYLIGDAENPAEPEEIEAFRNLLASTWTDPNLAIVWHHALQIHIEGTEGKLLNVGKELDTLERELLSGLMMSRAFTTGEGPTYANASVALDVLVARYLTFRERIEQWITRCVFEPLCRIHNIYKPSSASVNHRIRVKNKFAKPWVPKIKWAKINLRDDQLKISLYERMVEKKLIPKEELIKLVNLNPETIEVQLKEEIEKNGGAPEIGLPGVPSPGPLPGIPGSMGGGMEAPVEMPSTVTNEGPEGEQGAGIMPPESSRPTGMPGGIL